LICPFCGYNRSWRNGHRQGKQRWLCKNCGREFPEDYNTAQSRPLSRTPPTTLLVGETEKLAGRQVCGEVDTKKEGELQLCKQLQRGDLLKGFPKTLQAEILSFAVKKLNKGRTETTVKDYIRNLKLLLKAGADLHNPESVEKIIASQKWSNTTKVLLVSTYNEFCKHSKILWEPPTYTPDEKTPFIPLESELDQFIAGSGRTLSTFLQFLKESMARLGEAADLKWADIDFERRIIAINSPEKRGKARIFKATEKLLDMLAKMPRRGEKVFPTRETLIQLFFKQRKRLAYKLQNPRLLKIAFHTFRHWAATMLYHKTHDPFLVQRKLGHKNIKATQRYVHLEEVLFQCQTDEYHTATAESVEEARKLIEAGFEKHDELQGIHIYRKRK
jgi:integrase